MRACEYCGVVGEDDGSGCREVGDGEGEVNKVFAGKGERDGVKEVSLVDKDGGVSCEGVTEPELWNNEMGVERDNCLPISSNEFVVVRATVITGGKLF